MSSQAICVLLAGQAWRAFGPTSHSKYNVEAIFLARITKKNECLRSAPGHLSPGSDLYFADGSGRSGPGANQGTTRKLEYAGRAVPHYWKSVLHRSFGRHLVPDRDAGGQHRAGWRSGANRAAN